VKHALLIIALMLAPSLAKADQMRVTSYDIDDAGGTIMLASDQPIGEPWLRIEKGVVRVWFPRVTDIARFEHEREGDDAIRALVLRSGASETAVLRIELAHNRTLSADDIQIVRQGQQASVRVRVPNPKRASQPSAAAAPAAATSRSAAAPQPAAAGPVAAPAPVAVAAAAAAPAAGAPLTSKREPAFSDTHEAQRAGAPWLALGLATLLLGGVLTALQYFNRRRTPGRPMIEVIGARRIGHRQELVIVRALGSDHLLLCAGGRAERVASTPTPLALPEEELLLPPPPPSTDDSQAGGIISRLSSQHRLRKLLENVDLEREESRPAAAVGFGAALYSASRREARPSTVTTLPARRPSEAVAGINRLRNRAGA
jgi:hypothetical protein